ncbi:MAG: hypothetical protein ACPL4K_04600, partial [Candidatus Margulisiibacteriota bacterium]
MQKIYDKYIEKAMITFTKIKNKIQSGVRKHLSPQLTKFYAKMGFVNREELAKVLPYAKKETSRRLANLGIVKWRFRNVDLPKSKLEPWMLSGRITEQQLASIFAKQQPTTLDSKENFITKSFGVDCPGAKIAFGLGFFAAFTLPSIIAGSILPALLSLPAYLLISKGLIFYDKLNPNYTPYKFFKLGNDLLPWSLSMGLLAAGFWAYIESKEPIYYNPKDISIYSQGVSLYTKVNGNSCKLLDLKNQNEASRAASNLNQAAKDQSLFQNNLKIDNSRLLLTSRFLPSWTPDWALPYIPFGVTELFNLKGISQEKEAFARFFSNLWACGVMPSSEELAFAAIEKLERETSGFGFRDPGLQKKLELATLYYAVRDYQRAIALCKEITNYQGTLNTKTPIEYHEAIFLQIDVLRILTMKEWKPDYVKEIINLLLREKDKLSEVEVGYQIRYHYELLKSCIIAEQFFPKLKFDECEEANLNDYYQKAIFTYNHYAPLFADNFLAVRTFLESAKHLAQTQKFEDARKQLRLASLLFDLIDNCSNAANYPEELKTLGANANFSFALKCELSRIIRGDFWPINSAQFDSKLFGFLRAQTYLSAARIDLKLAEKNKEESEDYLLQAKTQLERALDIVRGIQQRDPFKFFTIMYEEK